MEGRNVLGVPETNPSNQKFKNLEPTISEPRTKNPSAVDNRGEHHQIKYKLLLLVKKVLVWTAIIALLVGRCQESLKKSIEDDGSEEYPF